VACSFLQVCLPVVVLPGLRVCDVVAGVVADLVAIDSCFCTTRTSSKMDGQADPVFRAGGGSNDVGKNNQDQNWGNPPKE
jgi:hypothetical protein